MCCLGLMRYWSALHCKLCIEIFEIDIHHTNIIIKCALQAYLCERCFYDTKSCFFLHVFCSLCYMMFVSERLLQAPFLIDPLQFLLCD